MDKHTPTTRRFRHDDGTRRPTGLAIFIAATMVTMLIVSLHATGIATAGNAAEDPATLLRCEPAAIAGVVGQPLDFDIYVEDVIDLWAGDVRLSFDPAVVQIVDADPDAEGIQIVILDDFLTANFILRKNGDNNAGVIRYAATYLNEPGGNEPATGSGALARVTFEPLQPGSFVMSFTYHLLNDRDGFKIEASVVNCPVTITDPIDSVMVTYMPLVFPGIKEPPPFKQ